MRKNSKRAAVVATVAAVAVGGLGVSAWAAGWFAEGTATGTAQSSDIKPLSATIALNGKIYPGVTREATVKVANPNDFKVSLNKGGAPTFSAKFLGNGQANSACTNSLSADVIKVGGLNGSTVIESGATAQEIKLPVTVGEIDKACASSELTMTMTFGGNSVV